jgi:hypothetical protein
MFCTGYVFEDLTMRCNPSNLVCGYLNINGLRYEYEHITDLLQRNLVDILFRSEAKIDPFFPDAQFLVTISRCGVQIKSSMMTAF